MKVGPFEIGRRRQFAAVKPPPGGELGVDSDHWLNRWAGGGPDPNVILSGSQKFGVYDEMALSDATCKALLWMVKLPLMGAIWDAEPASDSPPDDKGVSDTLIANAVRWNFGLADYDGQLDVTWRASIEQKLLKLRYGCMWEEIVWGDPVTFTDEDTGAARLIRPIVRMAPRLPRSVIDVEYDQGRVKMITQNLANAKPIPADKLAYYVLDAQPGRWDGTSMLRAAWGPWELKKQLMISAGIAWDRWASGIPIVRYPLSGGQAEIDKAEEMGRSVRNHERGYLAFAGPEPTDLSPDGWGFKIEGGPGNLPDPVPLLKQYDYEILQAGLQTFMALGNMHSGSRAVGQVQDEPYYMAVEAIATDLGLEIQRQAWRKFVDVNFGTEYDTPNCKASKIQSEDVAQLSHTLSELKLAGFDFSDVDTQNDVRERLHFPELPADWTPPGATEGSGLPAVPKPAAPPVPTGAQQLRAAERRLERETERMFRAFEKTVDALVRQPQLAPLPQQVTIQIPKQVADHDANGPITRLLEQAIAKLGERDTVELPPFEFRFEIEGEQKARTATVRKTAEGDTVVEYGYGDPAG